MDKKFPPNEISHQHYVSETPVRGTLPDIELNVENTSEPTSSLVEFDATGKYQASHLLKDLIDALYQHLGERDPSWRIKKSNDS